MRSAIAIERPNMAKRYYQSPRDRMAESRGMEREIRRKDVMRADDRMYDEIDRRRREMEDAGMIHEDKMAVANLPQNVHYKPYPKTDYYRYDLNDDIRGIDVQIDDDVRQERSKAGKSYPEKY